MPSRDAALAFKEGDILQVLNMDDPNWWQVCARVLTLYMNLVIELCILVVFRRKRWTRTELED